VTAGVDDGVSVFEDAVCEIVLSQILPDVFLRVQFGGLWRQQQQAYVVWYFEFVAPAMPACAIERDDSMGAHRYAAADFG
jgi:hypothetical protein